MLGVGGVQVWRVKPNSLTIEDTTRGQGRGRGVRAHKDN